MTLTPEQDTEVREAWNLENEYQFICNEGRWETYSNRITAYPYPYLFKKCYAFSRGWLKEQDNDLLNPKIKPGN